MLNPFAPLIAIAHWGIPFTASSASAPVPATQLKLGHLHQATRISGLPDPPGDASCKKVPPHASPNLDPRTQPIEKEVLKTS